MLMGLGCCPVLFSWLGELVPVFWLMELDLLSLKDSAESSSRFWSVHRFSMPLDVVLAFAVLGLGASISAAASKWPSQHNCSATSSLLVPGIIAGACFPVPPCTAG